VKILLEASPEMWATFTAFSAFGIDYINANEATVREEIARRVARWASTQPPSKPGLAGHYNAILQHDASVRLASIRCPTWIAVGSQDPVTPPSYAQRMHAAIVGSRLEIFPDRPAPHPQLRGGAVYRTGARVPARAPVVRRCGLRGDRRWRTARKR
jgi:pimeloyl-ACP methyl ester carboxylesterase